MKKTVTFLIATIAFCVSSLSAGQSPKLVVVKNHADWCGSCKALAPHFTDLQNKFDGKEVLFVRLDFTNQTSSDQSDLLAGKLGLDESITAGRKTGFISVVDENGGVLAKFTKSHSLSDMSNKLNELL